MTTATKKSKQSFKDRFAKPQTKLWSGVMFNGETAELEIRKLQGATELIAVRHDVQDYARKVSALQSKIAEFDDEANVELSDDDYRIIHEGDVLFGKLLKRVVVLPDGVDMSEDEWTTMGNNWGGLNSQLWREVSSAVGLNAVEAKEQDIPFSSAVKEG